jgi:hypothetical protein
MSKSLLTKEEKEKQLKEVKEILLATLDYNILNFPKLISVDFNSDKHYENLKNEVLKKYQKGSLSILKQWLRDLTDQPRETRDFEYVKYIKQATGYDFDIFEVFKKRIEKIIASKKITSENQYHDAVEMVDYLSQSEPKYDAKIHLLNELILKFDNKMNAKKKLPFQ